MEKLAPSFRQDLPCYQALQDSRTISRTEIFYNVSAVNDLSFSTLTSHDLRQSHPTSTSPLPVNSHRRTAPTRIPCPSNTSRVKNSRKALNRLFLEAGYNKECDSNQIKVSTSHLTGLFSFKKVSNSSKNLKNETQHSKILSLHHQKPFTRGQKPIIDNSISPEIHKVWQKNELKKSLTDSTQLQHGTKQLTLNLRKKMSQIYTLSSRSSSVAVKFNNSIKAENSGITSSLDDSLGKASPTQTYNQSNRRSSRCSIISPAALEDLNATESDIFTNTLVIQNFDANSRITLDQKVDMTVENNWNQQKPQASSLAYGYDGKIPGPTPSVNKHRRSESYKNDFKLSPVRVLPQNETWKALSFPMTKIPSSQNKYSSNDKPLSDNQKGGILSKANRFLYPVSPSRATSRSQTRKSLPSSSIPKMQSLFGPSIVLSNMKPHHLRSTSHNFTRAAEIFAELSSSPVTTSNSARHIHTAQQNAFWCGRFTSLHDRFHNDMLDTLVVDDKTYTRFQDNAKPIKRAEISPDNTKCNELTAGLQYLSDEEIRRCKKAFIHLGALCVTDEAKQSLWNFQLAFAKYRNEKHLLPSGGEIEADIL